jgi:antitoxin YefM
LNEGQEKLVVSCPNGKNVVVMSEDEFNSIQETLHLKSTSANYKRLSDAIAELNNGGGVKRNLIIK